MTDITELLQAAIARLPFFLFESQWFRKEIHIGLGYVPRETERLCSLLQGKMPGSIHRTGLLSICWGPRPTPAPVEEGEHLLSACCVPGLTAPVCSGLFYSWDRQESEACQL
jgi:hypothetical protein